MAYFVQHCLVCILHFGFSTIAEGFLRLTGSSEWFALTGEMTRLFFVDTANHVVCECCTPMWPTKSGF